jgi:hypothetical protein
MNFVSNPELQKCGYKNGETYPPASKGDLPGLPPPIRNFVIKVISLKKSEALYLNFARKSPL